MQRVVGRCPGHGRHDDLVARLDGKAAVLGAGESGDHQKIG